MTFVLFACSALKVHNATPKRNGPFVIHVLFLFFYSLTFLVFIYFRPIVIGSDTI